MMAASYNSVPVPMNGARITYGNGSYYVPDNPIIPFIEGDGTGRDIWKASVRVFDGAVEKAYRGKRRVTWYEIFAGEKAKAKFNNWLPDDSVNAIREFRVAIKGPLTTPVGGVILSLNVELESGRKSVTLVHKGNMQKFTEGAFRKWGYELATEEFRDKVVTERESWILDNKDKNPNLSAEDNAALVEPGLEFAPPEFGKAVADEVHSVLDSIYATHGHGAWKKKLMINDRIADSIFQQVVTRADEYSVLATPNLNGDYISDACAAQIGGLGIAPGANIGDGYAIFEATHGTAPKYADKDVINPGSVILSGVMMFRFLGWGEAADLIEHGVESTILQKKVTYDFERLMQGATKVTTSEFANYIIENMGAAALSAV